MKIAPNDKFTLLSIGLILMMVGYIIFCQLTGQLETHKSSIHAIDINPQGIVATTSLNDVLLWENRKNIAQFNGHTNTVKTVHFSHDGEQIASGSIDQKVKVWSVHDKKLITTLKGHTDGVNQVEFSKTDKYLLTAGYENKIFIRDWKNDGIVKVLDTKHTTFTISAHDILAYVNPSCHLVLFDLKSMQQIKVINTCSTILQFSEQPNILATKKMGESIFTFIDISSEKALAVMDIRTANSNKEVSAFEFMPGGKYIAISLWGGAIEIWDWKKKELVRTIEGAVMADVEDLSFNNKKELVSISGGTLKYWNWETGKLKKTVGDGSLKMKLLGVLYILVLVMLIVAFVAVAKDIGSKISYYLLLSVLTAWSLGLGIIVYSVRSKIVKYVNPIIWVSTVLSALFIFSRWFAFLALITIPIALLLCFVKIITNFNKQHVYTPLTINLLYCGLLCLALSGTL